MISGRTECFKSHIGHLDRPSYYELYWDSLRQNILQRDLTGQVNDGKTDLSHIGYQVKRARYHLKNLEDKLDMPRRHRGISDLLRTYEEEHPGVTVAARVL